MKQKDKQLEDGGIVTSKPFEININSANEWFKALEDVIKIHDEMKQKQLEKQLEDQCVEWARSHGWDAWKNENNGNKGIPDRSFLKGSTFIMVEFKRDASARIRPEQITWQRHHPDTVFFIWSFEDFTELLTNKNPKL